MHLKIFKISIQKFGGILDYENMVYIAYSGALKILYKLAFKSLYWYLKNKKLLIKYLNYGHAYNGLT